MIPDTEVVLKVIYAVPPPEASVVFLWLQRHAVSQRRVPRHIHDKGVIVGLHKRVPPTIQDKLAADGCKRGGIARRRPSTLVQSGILPLQLLRVQHEEVIQRLQTAFHPVHTRTTN